MDLIHTGPLYHMSELGTVGNGDMGTVSTAFGMCAHYSVCPQQICPALPRKRGVRGGFVNLCSLWAISCLLCDLGGRGQAVPMYYSAPAQQIQCAGESSWASWQNNS